tara:strand:- start:5957 stop:6568 length:612 start_codon:yes stop_codon:yes gene_type:complete
MRKIIIGLLVIIAIVIFGCSNSSVSTELEKKKALMEGTPVVGDHGDLISGEVVEEKNIGLQKGDLPPDFEIKLENGEEVNLRDYKGEMPVLLYFFATWCPHCANDFRELSNVYPDYKDDVKIIAQSLDLKENKGKIENYKEKYSPGVDGVDFLPGKESILRDYQIRYTTTKYAVDRNGEIIYFGSGEITENQWRVLLDTLKAT